MSKKVDYFESENIAPEDYTTAMVCIPTRYVPSIVSALETRKARSFWATDADFYRAYQVYTEVQMSLLNDCSEKIVNNIIALRGAGPTQPRDPVTGVPLVSPSGSTLVDIYSALVRDETTLIDEAISTNTTLGEIKTILQSQGGNDEDILNTLVAILAAL